MQQRLILDYAQAVPAASQLPEVILPVQYERRSRLNYVQGRSSVSRVNPTYSRPRDFHSSRPGAAHGPSYLVPRESSSVNYDRRPTVSYASPNAFMPPSPPPTPGSQIDPTDPTGIQGLLTQDSYALIDRKIREFQEMNERASELEAWVCLFHCFPFSHCLVYVLIE